MIDAVITWVDGADTRHQKSLADTLERLGIPTPNSAKPTRFDDSGELEYCLASLFKFAPWINRVFIVTDKQTPPVMEKLANTPLASRVRLIDHQQLFEGYPAALPTFNIRALVAMLWNIPDLSEKFLFLNDDFVITAPVAESDFFLGERMVLRGNYRYFSKTGPLSLIKGICGAKREPTARPGHNLGQELSARLAGINLRYLNLPHCPHPMQRSLLQRFYQEHPQVLNTNIGYPFRQSTQHIPEALAAYLALQQGLALIERNERSVIVKAGAISRTRLEQVLESCADGQNCFLCIQDLGEATEENQLFIKKWLNQRVGSFDRLLTELN